MTDSWSCRQRLSAWVLLTLEPMFVLYIETSSEPLRSTHSARLFWISN